jgi:hypothetical protein
MAEQSGPTHFRELFESALEAYEKKAGITLVEHSLAIQLQSCNTVESITAVLQGQAKALSESRGSDRVMKSIKNTVSILNMLSATASLAVDISLVRQQALVACSTPLSVFLQPFPPVKAIYAGLAILLAVCPFSNTVISFLLTCR